MALFPTVRVPAFEFQFNLAVYPLPATTLKTVSSDQFSSYRLSFKFWFRARVISMYSKIMLSNPSSLEAHTGLSFFLTMSTVSCHLMRATEEQCRSMPVCHTLWRNFSSACRCYFIAFCLLIFTSALNMKEGLKM